MKRITDFLKTQRSKDDLKTVLEVIREFKECESENEWIAIPFQAWAKFEQLEEYLDHLVNGTELDEHTINYMNYTDEELRAHFGG